MISLILSALARAFILANKFTVNALLPPKSLFAAFTLVHCNFTLSDAYSISSPISYYNIFMVNTPYSQ